MSYERPSFDFLTEARRIVDLTNERNIVLRVMGACAVRIHSPSSLELHRDKMNRVLTDLDFMGYMRQINEIRSFFKELGYEWDEMVARMSQFRDIFHDHVNKRRVDIFYDRLYMCHTIDFRKRLEVDYPTIPLAELVLEKTQIVKINEKDVKDVVVLFREHEVGDGDADVINARYISNLLANDWGFYHTVTKNLKDVRDHFVLRFNLLKKDEEAVKTRTNKLLDRVEKQPKSLKWKMRAKVGTKRKWYRDVEEVMR